MPIFYTDIKSDDGKKCFLTSGPYNTLEEAQANEHKARNIAWRLAEAEGNFEITWFSFGSCSLKAIAPITKLMKLINAELEVN